MTQQGFKVQQRIRQQRRAPEVLKPRDGIFQRHPGLQLIRLVIFQSHFHGLLQARETSQVCGGIRPRKVGGEILQRRARRIEIHGPRAIERCRQRTAAQVTGFPDAIQVVLILDSGRELGSLTGQWRHALAGLRVALRQRLPVTRTPRKLEDAVLALPIHLLAVRAGAEIPHQRHPQLSGRGAARPQHTETHRAVAAGPVVHADACLEPCRPVLQRHVDDAVRLHIQPVLEGAAVEFQLLVEAALERDVLFAAAQQSAGPCGL